MKYTNLANLPDAIVRAVTNDPYTKGDADFSITQLLNPPRISALERAHYNEIEIDVSDRIWSLIGQVAHGILERAEMAGIAERRLYAEINGTRISGGMDRYHNGVLQDYKVTSVYKVRNGLSKEWEEQMNCYAYLLRKNNIQVHKLEIIAILRDWSKMEARRDGEYPRVQIVTLDVPMWSDTSCLFYLEDRIGKHLNARNNRNLPDCTESERWAKPASWAVKKDGRVKALRVLPSENEALEFIKYKRETTAFVEYRPGESTRCEYYCPVSNFCEQFKRLKN